MVSRSRETWLAERRKYLTASDVGAVLGVDKYRTPLDVWADKVLDDEPPDAGEAAHWGTVLQPTVLAEYAERRQVRVVAWPDFQLFYVSDKWWAVTPDATEESGEEPAQDGAIEIKVSGDFPAWADGPPLSYRVQLQVQMDALRLPRGTIVLLALWKRPLALRWWDYDYNAGFCDQARSKCRRWWARFVETKTPPTPDGSQAAARALQRIYTGGANGEPQRAVGLPEGAGVVRQRYIHWKKAERFAEGQAQLNGNILRSVLGAARYGVCPGGEVVGWVGQDGKRQLRTPDRLPRGVKPPDPWS